MKKKRKRSKRRGKGEPYVDSAPEWMEWGGELYWAVDETSGGAPIGLTRAELLSGMDAGSAGAKCLVRLAFERAAGDEPEVGRVVFLGEGISREAYAATVEHQGTEYDVVALLPRWCDPERDQRVRREAGVLARLAALEKPFRTPRPIAALPTDHGVALVVERLYGLPLDLRAGRMGDIRPWEVVGTLAAAVHALPGERLGDLPGHRTRRGHGEHTLAAFRGLASDPDPRVATALAWMRAHLPPDEPATVLHGDLLGQNILVPVLDPSEPYALLDWERAQWGDPAYDLAIVMRGVRRPFQVADGFDRLLQAYREASGRALDPRAVRFHELGLLLALCADSVNRVRQSYLRQIEVVLALAGR